MWMHLWRERPCYSSVRRSVSLPRLSGPSHGMWPCALRCATHDAGHLAASGQDTVFDPSQRIEHHAEAGLGIEQGDRAHAAQGPDPAGHPGTGGVFVFQHFHRARPYLACAINTALFGRRQLAIPAHAGAHCAARQTQGTEEIVLAQIQTPREHGNQTRRWVVKRATANSVAWNRWTLPGAASFFLFNGFHSLSLTQSTSYGWIRHHDNGSKTC